MDPQSFNALDPYLDALAELAEEHLADPEFGRILTELGKILGERYGVGINLTVDVFDDKGYRSLPLLNTGLCKYFGKEPFRTTGDSTPQRYVVKEGIQVVPHDRCPVCWQGWDFKWKNPSCSHCGTTLGENCKILLDTDVCPLCEEGQVSMAKPRCNKCGHEIDPRTVVWG